MNVLVEGIGSMVFNTQLKYYNEMGWNIIGIDIDNFSSGLYTVSKGYIVPKYCQKNCFDVLEDIIIKEKIDLVFPTINEGLLGWSKRKTYFFEKYGTRIIISDEKVIEICTDKWNTYHLFKKNHIPTPETSLSLKYDLIKPRIGRGSSGIFYKNEVGSNFDMTGNISQEIVDGDEYTIDILCNFESDPIYIIPRQRIGVESGVSVKGITVYDEEIISYCKRIIEVLKPVGIINIQCIRNKKEINFIEINPRIAGGSSLSFAASDNWFKALEAFILGERYQTKDIKYNLHMFRAYTDVVVEESELIR